MITKLADETLTQRLNFTLFLSNSVEWIRLVHEWRTKYRDYWVMVAGLSTKVDLGGISVDSLTEEEAVPQWPSSTSPVAELVYVE